MYELKIYRGVLRHENEEWYEIWWGIDLSARNWHEEFDKFCPEHSKISKICNLIGCFWPKYIMVELKGTKMLLVCYNLLNSQNIPINQYHQQWKMVGCRKTAKKAAEVEQKKSNNWPMVSFIHNGSEITTWMGHSFKTKNKIQSNIFKITMSFLNLKLRIIRLGQRHWSCTPPH